VVQHEFGIFGGEDGSEVVDLVRQLEPPVIVVLHTILREPTPNQRAVIDELAHHAELLVVQSEAARLRLIEQHDVDSHRVRTIPHGAADTLVAPVSDRDPEKRTILSWGLLSPGKGIELGIRAIAELGDVEPAPRYVVIGQTHPRIRARDGEAYRASLAELAEELGVGGHVEFDDNYYDTRSLLRKVRQADVVLLPYRSREQVVSGVLVEAIAAGKPVVATRFPHAEELLSAGSGFLVPHDDPRAMADALRGLLNDSELAWRTSAAARLQAKELLWPAVARRYLELIEELTSPDVTAGTASPHRLRPRMPFPAPPLQHLRRLTDRTGIFEFAREAVPRREHGYCTDDVARALIAVVREPVRSREIEHLTSIYLGFLQRAQLGDGRFHNRLSLEHEWLDEVGCDDAIGRALWAAGEAAARATDPLHQEDARALFEAGARFDSIYPRSNAFASLGAAALLSAVSGSTAEIAQDVLRRAARRLGKVSSDPPWPWPESRLTYANAVLPEARIAAGVALEDDGLLTEGLELLSWLVETESSDGWFSFTPAGGWGPGEPRPGFDQQPIEAAAMVDACARAFDVTGEREWAEHALRAAAWFLGENDVGVSLFDWSSGGGRDGLKSNGVNRDQGAESTLALVTALQQARRLQFLLRQASRRNRASRRTRTSLRSA
jgi:glycosyltransferase involved in cell wall biosynthesis